MALQPATGARDLNPQQVESNQLISSRLADVYRLWGYDEVSPPTVERLETLMAGGAISNEDIVKLVANEPLGLRPEMTASIARAACTRLAHKPRPLRLWGSGTVFETKETAEGGLSIEENLQSGVELFGEKGIAAEMELLALLLESLKALNLDKKHKPTLLIGHTALMGLILSNLKGEELIAARESLITYDRLSLENLGLNKELLNRILKAQECRGFPTDVVDELENIYGESDKLDNIKRLFSLIEPVANSHNITLQLDPTFQPHFKLYTGLVFQLVCEGESSPVVIARGGRYDEIVNRCSEKTENAAGVGFSFAIDRIRELQKIVNEEGIKKEKILIAFGLNSSLEIALVRQREFHKKGFQAQIELTAFNDRAQAEEMLKLRSCSNLVWIDS